jgi:hypothetical protein
MNAESYPYASTPMEITSAAMYTLKLYCMSGQLLAFVQSTLDDLQLQEAWADPLGPLRNLP